MALTTAASDTLTHDGQSAGLVGRLIAAIIKAREAQAQSRMASELRDHLPKKMLRDIGMLR